MKTFDEDSLMFQVGFITQTYYRRTSEEQGKDAVIACLDILTMQDYPRDEIRKLTKHVEPEIVEIINDYLG